MSRKLAEILLKDKIINENHFEEAESAGKKGKSYVRTLIEKGVISETKLLYYLSKKFGLPSINLDKFQIKPNVIELIPKDLVRKTQAIPIQANEQKRTLVVAVCDPSSLMDLESIKFKLKMSVEAVLTTFSAFDRAMQKNFGGAANVGQAIETFKKGKEGDDNSIALELVEVHNIDDGATEQDAPVITLVNGILSEGIRHMASDIHVEPYETRFRVRMRIDGSLREVAQVPIEMKRAVLTRFKIMSRMNIAESRVPQDGRIKLRATGTEIDFRVNTLPTLFGEKIVLRMLHKGNLKLDLTALGFEKHQLELFMKGIHSPNGMVLVTGPTGSGKTTTLYSALYELNDISENLATVEDPVEYNLEGINQTQIHKEIGLTFANVLRALLRQDPDTILVGEIRDFETAEVAIQAALTGHLVLSTLHTNDAPSTVVRLMNMGIEPFLVTSALVCVLAQRLMRKICDDCKKEQVIPLERLKEIGIPEEDIKKTKFYKGEGCSSCNNSGYRGRVAIYEVMNFSQGLKEMVLRGANGIELRKKAVEEGMQSMRDSAMRKALDGLSTLEEALSITMEH